MSEEGPSATGHMSEPSDSENRRGTEGALKGRGLSEGEFVHGSKGLTSVTHKIGDISLPSKGGA